MTDQRERRAGRLVLLAEVAVAAGLTLYASRHNASVLLRLMFVVWVTAPFVGMSVSRIRRSVPRLVGLVVSFGSLAIYAAAAFGFIEAKLGFVFLVVPLVSWIVIAAVTVFRSMR